MLLMGDKIIYIVRRLAGRGSQACQVAAGRAAPMDQMLVSGGASVLGLDLSPATCRDVTLSLIYLRDAYPSPHQYVMQHC